MIEIDGSYGEGGGQILRTSLALSALTGQSIHVRRVRAGRRNPGLAPQHLAAVLAVAGVCRGRLGGAHLRSTELIFEPGDRPQAGEYRVDVTQAAQGGSAGSVALILQAVLLPLAFAGAPSRVTLRGGTHVPASPPTHYLEQVYLPALARLGLRAHMTLGAWGFYPAGGGELQVEIEAVTHLTGTDFVERGPLRRLAGVAVAANLPAHIAQRIRNRAHNVLAASGLRPEITPVRARGAGPGAGIFLTASYQTLAAGFSALGARGKPSDQVADEACQALLSHHAQGAPVDPHLADQLLLPLALTGGASRFTTSRVTGHLLTNIHVIRQFLPVSILLAGTTGGPGEVHVAGSHPFR